MIELKASSAGYLFEIKKLNSQNRKLASRLVMTERGFEFAELDSLPRLVIKGQLVRLGKTSVSPKQTRTITREKQLEWIEEHGLEFDPLLGEFLPSGASLPTRFKFDKISASCFGVPKINALMTINNDADRLLLKMASGYIGDNGYFYGFINYETD